MATTLAAQATEGLRIVIDAGIVRVDDGFDQWICRLDPWLAAIDRLEVKPALDGDDAGALAYRELCGEVAAPVASVHGTSRGEYVALVRDAARVRLVNPEIYGIVIHILHHGFSLCPQSEQSGLPRDWSEGHLWCTVGEHERRGDATCPACIEVYRVNSESLKRS